MTTIAQRAEALEKGSLMGNLARRAGVWGIEMNREQVKEMMIEAGAGHDHQRPNDYGGVVDVFAKFAELVAAAEREACAKVCEEISDDYRQSESHLYPEMKTDAQAGASDCEAAIRARNTNKETK